MIPRLQMFRHGREFGNEFRYRKGTLDLSVDGGQPRLDGDYLEVDLARVAQGLGARGIRAGTAAAWARELGREDCAGVLVETLVEEKAADARLTELAESRLNPAAEAQTA